MTNSYITKDFYLSAFLIASGIDLQAYRKTNEGFTLFVFDNSDELDQHVNKYFSPRGYVRAVDFGNAIRNLKGIIHRTNSNATYVKHSIEAK